MQEIPIIETLLFQDVFLFFSSPLSDRQSDISTCLLILLRRATGHQKSMKRRSKNHTYSKQSAFDLKITLPRFVLGVL